MDLGLTGKTVVILGATGGMGEEIARQFAKEGAKVVLAARDENAVKALANELGGIGVACDITRPEQLEALMEKALAETGRLDVSLNAVGWSLLKPFLETTPDEIEKMMSLQFKGPYQWMQASVAAMKKAGNGGSIIQISSATATLMMFDHALYMGTKAGINQVVRAVAEEFGADGIRANTISPGVTFGTKMSADALPGVQDAFVPSYPLGRTGTVADIANAAVWVASDTCYMTGENFQVNGGLSLRRNPNQQEFADSIGKAMAAQGA